MNPTFLIAIGQSLALSTTGLPMHLAEPSITDAGLDIPVEAPTAALKRTERHVLPDRIVLFVPGVTASAPNRSLATGPVSMVRVTQGERGVAITLMTREPGTRAAERLELTAGEHPAIHLATVGAGHAVSDDAVTAGLANPEAAGPETLNLAAQAPATGRHPNGPTLGNVTNNRESPVPTMVLAGLSLLALAVVAWWLKRKRVKDQPGTSIQVLAVRAIGPKQKLMMVETSGERFLLASSDKDIHLLSALTAETGAEPVPEPSFSERLATAEAELPPSADLAGLIRLSGRQIPTREVAA
jgi:flagellar biogenesis protein FliO